jgi:hypothetical protein
VKRPARLQAPKPKLIPIGARPTVGDGERDGMAVKHETLGGSPLKSFLHFDQHGRPVSLENVVGNDVRLRRKKRKKRDLTKKALKTLYRGRIPPREELSNADLYRAARNIGIDSSYETVMRATGRRK